ncbi:MAG: GtrA family protein [Alphaproteobacteria bacterium]|nr:GtrA family protein [Alphaproteobacteria bacterium]MBU1516830.1 GtrA family protein [Alphaproteobacteria bacterium]MBU2092524.1 GtrA family protein [Alphaproteobacteria bacterium]MBU2151364.1 GtrA family protein [Alphaproteobacteria bacterium]MBU2309667.1 GtrA family protein [Alphaproteobacteria bacterium]
MTQQVETAPLGGLAKSAPRQLLVFAVVGGLATVTHFVLALLANTQFGAPPLVANVVGYVGAVMISYVGNARFTFQRRVLDRAQFVRFGVVSLAGLALGQAITYLATQALHLPFQLTLMVVVASVPVFTFVTSRLWAFATTGEAESAEHVAKAAPLGAVDDARDALAVKAQPILFGAIFVLACLPVLAAPVLPMIDYYSHIARFFVLAHIDQDPFLAQHYRAHWQILPNIGLDVLATALMRGLPTMAVAKAIVLVIFGLQYFGLLAFNRQLTGRSSVLVALLSAALLYSFILGWGFANFLLGLSLVFWGATWWLAQRHRLKLALPVACVLAALIFLTHGVAFLLYGLLLGGLELGLYLKAENRSFRTLAKMATALGAQAIGPVLLFIWSPTSQAPGGLTNAGDAIRELASEGRLGDRISELFTYRLATIVRVSESPSLMLDIVVFCTAIGLLAILAARRKLTVPLMAMPSVGIAILLVGFMPPSLLGVGYIADRMPYFLALLLVGCFVVQPSRSRLDQACIAALGALVVVKVGWIGVAWQGYRSDFADFRAVAGALPSRNVVGFLNTANLGRVEDAPRCQMYGPLTIPMYGQAADIFAYGWQQPIALAGSLELAVHGATLPPSPHSAKDNVFATFAAMQRQGAFDYVLFCGDEAEVSRRMHLTPVAHQGRFSLYRIGRAQAATP